MNTKHTIKIQTKVKEEELSLECTARWLSLMEAIYIIGKKADEMGINIDKSTAWIKPIGFQKYMDDRFTSMLHEIQLDLGIFTGGLKQGIKCEEEVEESA
jgi:hypothetical protein